MNQSNQLSGMSLVMQNAILTGNVVKLESVILQGISLNKPEKEFGLQWEPHYNFYRLVSGDLYYASSFGENCKYGEYIPWTPLQYASIFGNDRVIETLLAKSDPTIRDKAGQSAKDIAHRRCHQSTVDILDLYIEKYEQNRSSRSTEESSQNIDTGESQNEINMLRNENISIKIENCVLKSTNSKLVLENDTINKTYSSLKTMVVDPKRALSDPSKIQDMIDMGVPLVGVCLLLDSFKAIDKNSAQKLGAIISMGDLANRVDSLMSSESINLVEADRLYSGMLEVLSKWKTDELNSVELEREMMFVNETQIIPEKILFLKSHPEVFKTHIFEQYHLSKTFSKQKGVVFTCLDRFVKLKDETIINEIISMFINPYIDGKQDSELDTICESYRMDVKVVIKNIKAKYELAQLLPTWQKRMQFLQTAMNGKSLIKLL
jgi:hypothetical protein